MKLKLSKMVVGDQVQIDDERVIKRGDTIKVTDKEGKELLARRYKGRKMFVESDDEVTPPPPKPQTYDAGYVAPKPKEKPVSYTKYMGKKPVKAKGSKKAKREITDGNTDS